MSDSTNPPLSVKTPPLKDRVYRGAALLDHELPGWWQDIDLDRLNMASDETCVLGQIFGSFSNGGRQQIFGKRVSPAVIGDYGFGPVTKWERATDDRSDMNALWRAEIEARRAAHPRLEYDDA